MLELEKKFGTDLFEVLLLVEEQEDGMRLDAYLAGFLVSFSRQMIKRKIASGEVRIQGRPYPHKSSVKVYAGEKIEVFTPRGELEDEYWNGKKLELQFDPEIIFEDENLVVISKPPYMTTHPTGKHLFNCATVYFENKYHKTIHSIHRIDRETSGVLLLGKNPQTAGEMTTLFENDEVHKCYFFLAKKNTNDTIQFPIVAKERMGQRDDYIPRLYVHIYPEDSLDGKHAQTTFYEVYQDKNFIFGLAFPKTGRQHQIRAHAAFHSFPLVGDKLYNGDPTVFMRFKDGVATKEDHELMELSRHALHATALNIAWPSKENPSTFMAHIPHDFKEWISKKLPELNIDQLELKVSALIKDLL